MMTKRIFLQSLATLLLLAGPVPTAMAAAPAAGTAAPEFSLPDSDGKTHSLSEYRGKIVVLEWTNPHCPYVRKHYDSGNMQKLQQDAKQQGVVWLSINSSAPGTEGYSDTVATKKDIAGFHSAETARLMDPDGKVGHLYDAKTTPDMVVIDEKGIVRYTGAIDDAPSADPKTLVNARNYVKDALAALKAGKPVDPIVTRSYGCSVKYQGS